MGSTIKLLLLLSSAWVLLDFAEASMDLPSLSLMDSFAQVFLLNKDCALIGEKCDQQTPCCAGLRCLFYAHQCVTSDPISGANA